MELSNERNDRMVIFFSQQKFPYWITDHHLSVVIMNVLWTTHKVLFITVINNGLQNWQIMKYSDDFHERLPKCFQHISARFSAELQLHSSSIGVTFFKNPTNFF